MWYKETVEGKTDGSWLTVSGPRIPEGIAIAYKKIAPNKLSFTAKIKDKITAEGNDTLAADGKSFTEVSWAPGKESEKTIAFYAKQ